MGKITQEILLSDRASGIKASVTMAITALSNQLKKEGKPVIGMSAGEPDFDTPDKQAGIQSIRMEKQNTRQPQAL